MVCSISTVIITIHLLKHYWIMKITRNALLNTRTLLPTSSSSLLCIYWSSFLMALVLAPFWRMGMRIRPSVERNNTTEWVVIMADLNLIWDQTKEGSNSSKRRDHLLKMRFLRSPVLVLIENRQPQLWKWTIIMSAMLLRCSCKVTQPFILIFMRGMKDSKLHDLKKKLQLINCLNSI